RSFGYAHPYAIFSNNYVDCTTIAENMHPEYYTVGIEAYQADSTNVIFNNIFTNCRIGVRYEGDPTLFVRYSDFYNIAYELFHGDSVIFDNCIFSNPMILDSTDFHLQAYSPCIDTGDPNVYDPDSTRSDMGVYGGPWGESYVYLDLPPEVPDSLETEVAAGMDTIYLEWLFNTEADFNRYQFHRDTVDGFQPSVFNLIAEP
ncbi:MAG: hypothetical protein GWN00_01930, partial [Aliifodinibius sp.]|nr:hypothetical protein [Fodinibius sp.]NIV10028.1 hypothetical protein [Fodinibius sp.]NIY23616.1 hypothetical protein [Fodinibius sp.]